MKKDEPAAAYSVYTRKLSFKLSGVSRGGFLTSDHGDGVFSLHMVRGRQTHPEPATCSAICTTLDGTRKRDNRALVCTLTKHYETRVRKELRSGHDQAHRSRSRTAELMLPWHPCTQSFWHHGNPNRQLLGRWEFKVLGKDVLDSNI